MGKAAPRITHLSAMKFVHRISRSAALFALALPACTGFQPSADPGAPATVETSEGSKPIPSEGTFAIDLAVTLQLASGRNLALAGAVEEANRAAARSDKAILSLLPDLSAGASFAKQNGLLQETSGKPADVERVNDSVGFGTNGGAPGVGVNLPLGRAIFSPLVARQDRKAAIAAAEAKEHAVLAEAAVAYFDLVRARHALRLAREIEEAAGKLANATREFAKAGEGLDADAERASAAHFLRKGQSARALAEVVRRSSALARVLHLPATLTLVPTDQSVAAVDLVDLKEPNARLVATALQLRPETRQMKAEVAAAGHRLMDRKVKPFLPNLSAGYSNFEFAAGSGSSTEADGPREEVAAMIYWKLEGLGFGDAAEAREKQAELKLARLREAAILDQIADEVISLRSTAEAERARLPISQQASGHAKKAYELTTARLLEAQGLPIEAMDSIRLLAEARQAEVDSIIDYNIAQHRLFAAIGHPR